MSDGESGTARQLEVEIVGPDQKSLLDLEERFRNGFREQVLALHEIRGRELFRSMGYKHFLDYCRERLDIQRSHAYRLLDVAETIQELGSSPIGDKITHEGLVRPLAGMNVAGRARVITTAARVAEKRGVALTGKIVEDVAVKNMGWKPRKQFKQEQAAKKQAESGVAAWVAKLSEHAQKIADLTLQYTPEEAVQKFGGDAFEWKWFKELHDFVTRAARVSP